MADAERSGAFGGAEQQKGAGLRIVNAELGYGKAPLIEPTKHGYVYMAASVQPGRFPLVLPSAGRARLVAKLKVLAEQLEDIRAVVKATVFRAIVVPPTARFSSYLKERGASLHRASFDVVVLIETTSPTTVREVQGTAPYAKMLESMRTATDIVWTLVARNARRIGDVDTMRQGLFLFNHFVAQDPAVMLQLWDYLAGWYVEETGLDNSIALVPVDGQASDYAIIHWARWDVSPLRHFWHQVSKESFWKYVTANLDANRAASMPIYHRLA